MWAKSTQLVQKIVSENYIKHVSISIIMPSLEEHCEMTLKRYGVEGRDIHTWLDEPSREYAASHRQFRHDSETVKLVGELFGKTYGASLAENIALDHIMVDHQEEIKNRGIGVVKVTGQAGNSCSFCGSTLKPSDLYCPNCNASMTSIIEERNRANELEKMKRRQEKKEIREELKLELEYRGKTPLQRLYDLNRYRSYQFRGAETDRTIKVLERLVREDIKNDPDLENKLKAELEKQAQIRKALSERRAEKRVIAFILLSLSSVFLWLYIHPIVGAMTFIIGGVFASIIT